MTNGEKMIWAAAFSTWTKHELLRAKIGDTDPKDPMWKQDSARRAAEWATVVVQLLRDHGTQQALHPDAAACVCEMLETEDLELQQEVAHQPTGEER